MPGLNSEARDNNYIPVAKWVDMTDKTKTLPLLVNPSTWAVLCET